MANDITDLRGVSRVFPVYDSTARTATPNTQEFENLGRFVGLVLVIDVTAVTSTPSVTFAIDGVDRVSGKTFNLITSVAIAATGTTKLRVRPALTAAANVTVNDLLPPVIRVSATHGNANSITYTVTGHLTY